MGECSCKRWRGGVQPLPVSAVESVPAWDHFFPANPGSVRAYARFAALNAACEGCIMWRGGLRMHTSRRNPQLGVLDLCRILPCDRGAPKERLSQGTACSAQRILSAAGQMTGQRERGAHWNSPVLWLRKKFASAIRNVQPPPRPHVRAASHAFKLHFGLNIKIINVTISGPRGP